MIDANTLLHRYALTVVKARSTAAETYLPDEILERISPFLFGPKCILRACEIMTNRGNPTHHDIANLLIVGNDLEPSIAITYLARWYEPLPTWEEWMKDGAQ